MKNGEIFGETEENGFNEKINLVIKFIKLKVIKCDFTNLMNFTDFINPFMLRKEIIKKFINTEDIQHIIWHHGSVFIKDTFTTALYLFVLYIIYFVLSSYIKWAFLPWIFGLIGIGFFIKFILIFLNTYLDGLVLSSQGITLFMREGLTKYKTDFFDWEKIQTVSHNQNS